jgi:hypothetical protein
MRFRPPDSDAKLRHADLASFATIGTGVGCGMIFCGWTQQIIVSVSLMAGNVGATSLPPTPYIDKGVCPFEGCIYRPWVAKKEIILVSQPGSKNKLGVVHAGERVVGLTGEVHSIPILVHAAEDVPDPRNRDQVLIPKSAAYYVIHYLGEGTWLCWYKGQLTEVENFSDRGPFPKATWWVKVGASHGLTGWTISDDNFDGQDALG